VAKRATGAKNQTSWRWRAGQASDWPGPSPSDPPSAPPTSRRSSTYEEISQRAYFIALEQGDGDDVANWLRVARELATA